VSEGLAVQMDTSGHGVAKYVVRKSEVDSEKVMNKSIVITGGKEELK